MRRIIYVLIALLASFFTNAQDMAEVTIAQLGKLSTYEWAICDSNNETMISSSELLSNDTAYFSLEANKRFFLHVAIEETSPSDSLLLSLAVSDNPIILVQTSLEKGDHRYPFFTGVVAPQLRIIGGKDASIYSVPWQACFFSGDYLCGGSIIGSRWILTAAHCAFDADGNNIDKANMYVVVGTSTPFNGKSGKLYRVRNLIIYNDYNDKTHIGDLALLELNEVIDFENATSIELVNASDVANGATDPGVMGTVSGWGYTDIEKATVSDVLQKVDLPIVSRFTASHVWPNISPSFIMAGYATAGGDACRGDSGGPYTVTVDGIVKLAGVVSWGSSDCNNYGAYTRVSDYVSWINSNTDEFDHTMLDYPEGDRVICFGTSNSIYTTKIRMGATDYEWQLWPDSAGTVNGMNDTAKIAWTPYFEGRVSVRVRATVDNVMLPWASLVVYITKPAKVIAQPLDTSVCANQPFIISPKVQGYTNRYFWYKDGAVFDTLSTNNLVFPYLGVTDAGVYSFSVSNICGDAISEAINLVVNPVTSIVRQPNGSLYSKISGGGLSVDVEGVDLAFQWFKDGVLIDGATNNRVVISDNESSNIGFYHVTIEGGCGKNIVSQPYYYFINGNLKGLPDYVNVRPTVTADEVSISVNSSIEYNIELFTEGGVMVLEKQKCQYDTQISLKRYRTGIYLLRVRNPLFHGSCKIKKL